MRPSAGGNSLHRLAISLIALTGVMPLLVWFSWLRETPVFWTNAGGYPIWLREFVLVSYYPLLIISLGGSGIHLWLLLSNPPRSRRFLCGEFAVFMLQATAIAIAIAIHFVTED